MMTVLRVLKWLTDGGLSRLTDAIQAVWAIFEEISALLGITHNAEPTTKRNQVAAMVGDLGKTKERGA